MYWFLAKLLLWLLFSGLIFFTLGWLFRGRRASSDLEKISGDLRDEKQQHREAKLKVKEVTGREADMKTEIDRRKNQQAEADTKLKEAKLKLADAKKSGGGGKVDDAELVQLKQQLDICRDARKELQAQVKAGAGKGDSDELAKLRAERDQLASNLKAAKEKAASASSGGGADASGLKADNQKLVEELKALKASTATREGAKNEEVAMLKNKVADLEKTAKEAPKVDPEAGKAAEAAKAENQKLAEELKQLKASTAKHVDETAGLKAKISELEKSAKDPAEDAQMKIALDKSRDRIKELEGELKSGQGQLGLGAVGAGAGVVGAAAGAVGGGAGSAELQKERDALQAQLDTLKGSLEAGAEYASGAKASDDLTMISGVGPGLKTKLNSFGIYTFRQIADWEKGSIDAFDALLAFPGRIERDEWQKQARQLHVEKHGPN